MVACFSTLQTQPGVDILKTNLAECVWNGAHLLPPLPGRGKTERRSLKDVFNENLSEFPACFPLSLVGIPLAVWR